MIQKDFEINCLFLRFLKRKWIKRFFCAFDLVICFQLTEVSKELIVVNDMLCLICYNAINGLELSYIDINWENMDKTVMETHFFYKMR